MYNSIFRQTPLLRMGNTSGQLIVILLVANTNAASWSGTETEGFSVSSTTVAQVSV